MIDKIVDRSINEYRALQRPEELKWLLEKTQLLSRKELAVELGVCRGGTYYALQTQFQGVIGVDTGRHSLPFLLRTTDHYLIGSTKDQVIIDKVPNEIDFLLIDADHSYEGVSGDFNLWRWKVRKGGMIAFHDISGAVGQDGVKRFWSDNKDSFGRIDEIRSHESLFGIGVVWND